MKYILLLFVIVFAHSNAIAQDSIYFFDGTIKAVKILEISPDVVKYTWPTSDLPIYIVNKQDVHYIKYSNGIADTLNKYPPKALIKNSENNRKVEFNIDNKLIILDNKAIQYQGKRYGNMAIKKIIEKEPYRANNPDLMVEYTKMRKYLNRRKTSTLFGIIGFVVPAYIGFVSFIIYGVNPNSQVGGRYLEIGLGTGALVGGTFIPIAIKYNKKLIKQRDKLVELYNNTP